MSRANAVSNMIQNEDFNTMSQFAVVNNDDLDDLNEEDVVEIDMDDELEDEVREEASYDNVQVPSTYTNLEEANLTVDENWITSSSESKKDFIRDHMVSIGIV
ncbi:hypothetical protein QVD17_06884 [Tagetes erecta]|uniref:Uncharacterized protein n=1 Tax=Tagetes erecta TaxID=13708 RepID=A0AAD8PBN4_TARER|nr:hypothetical protein QVD17_06884 [Tagetes erecta]